MGFLMIKKCTDNIIDAHTSKEKKQQELAQGPVVTGTVLQLRVDFLLLVLCDALAPFTEVPNPSTEKQGGWETLYVVGWYKEFFL